MTHFCLKRVSTQLKEIFKIAKEKKKREALEFFSAITISIKIKTHLKKKALKPRVLMPFGTGFFGGACISRAMNKRAGLKLLKYLRKVKLISSLTEKVVVFHEHLVKI